MMLRPLAVLFAIVVPYLLPAQIQPCIDVRSSVRNTEAGQGVYDYNNKWTPGTRLKVSFLNGTEWQRNKVKQYAPEWCRYANVKFQFVDEGPGDVRVSFNKKGSYSFIGADARNRKPSEETMNLGWIEGDKPEAKLKSVILHEFGHALGLLHEHMNPMSNIRWNKDVVYAWYMQSEGWGKDMVDQQVFDRYSVKMTNRKYDPKSIMHYPIPAEFTLDGYHVGENYDLSESDKKLIGELYPDNRVFPDNNKTALWTRLQELDIEYNVVENGRQGLKVRQNFIIYNAQRSKCIMAVYFYNADDGKPLLDRNGIKTSADGKVAAYTFFTPAYASAQYNDLGVFMPYDELELGSGNYRLKCYVALFDPNLKLITSSGYQYFTFSKGISSTEIRVQARVDAAARQVDITPIFTIENAQGANCRAVAYFYDDKGVPLKDANRQYMSVDGTVSSTVDFSPGFTTTLYNNDGKDFNITLPTDELHLGPGVHKLQYRVVLYDENWNRIVSSPLQRLTITQD